MIRTRPLRCFVATLVALILCGCGRAPSFDVLGSFFPGWIAAAALGVLLSLLLRWFLIRRDLDRHVTAPPLFYLAVATLLAALFWLLVYA